MRLPRLAPWILALACLATVAPAAAQTAPIYQVELIVFQTMEPVGPAAERPPSDPAPFAVTQLVRLDPPEGGPGGYRLLPATQYRLQGVYQQLERSNAYRPLLHLAWRQPGLGKDAAGAVAIPVDWMPGAEGAGVFGYVRVYRERFIHAEVDLRMRGASGLWANTQSRRMKNGEMHYLDHPTLGAIIQVTRIGGGE